MKHLTTTMCSVLLALLAVTGYSQQKSARPSLFANHPASMECTESQLASLFAVAKGQNISVSLNDDFTVAGPVTSNLSKYKNLQTIVIKLPAFNNTLFSLSKQTTADNQIIYVGRIINPIYADGYELQRNPDGNYQLTKIDIEKILVNCSQ
jgi:hypothetical protein